MKLNKLIMLLLSAVTLMSALPGAEIQHNIEATRHEAVHVAVLPNQVLITPSDLYIYSHDGHDLIRAESLNVVEGVLCATIAFDEAQRAAVNTCPSPMWPV
jgi:hypothetical protein